MGEGDIAESSIVRTGLVREERLVSTASVAVTGGVIVKSLISVGCVEAAVVEVERLHTGRCVLGASGIAIKGAESRGGVFAPGGVFIERLKTKPGVVDAGSATDEHSATVGGVVAGHDAG